MKKLILLVVLAVAGACHADELYELNQIRVLMQNQNEIDTDLLGKITLLTSMMEESRDSNSILPDGAYNWDDVTQAPVMSEWDPKLANGKTVLLDALAPGTSTSTGNLDKPLRDLAGSDFGNTVSKGATGIPSDMAGTNYQVVFHLPFKDSEDFTYVFQSKPDTSKPAGQALNVVRLICKLFCAVMLTWTFVKALIHNFRFW